MLVEIMRTLINSKVNIQIIEVHAYGVIGLYKNCRIYVDLVEISWKSPIPESIIPKAGEEIRVLISSRSTRPDSDYLGSVKYLNPKQNPWYNPSIYKTGDFFIGTIDEANTFGCWALHPSGADVRIMINGKKEGLRVGDKVKLKITGVHPDRKSMNAELAD
ncbi:hypothetical protein MUN82_12590 [Hymenobacter aerilatus]|uniref:S1 motif domain-containing protein n=1 Tax=Hymenobacter aerilatus TaxID=2932251 RepID=A0A8T9SPQ8_9BACT|nr:hypothetical protein [Hymenobacter aerilatus]UOR03785.1 hypothetical protein MUN82_12590 [Hymenobacter aerilatus]